MRAVALSVPAVKADSFEELYERYSAQALRFAVAIAGNVPRGEDMAATAMLKVLRRWRQGGIDQFWPYLRTTILNELRSEIRRGGVVEVPFSEVEAESADDDADSFDRLISDRATLLAGLEQLPAMQRAAIALRYLEDLPERQVAELLGCRVGTVKSSVSRGLMALRRRLEQEQDHD